jgi:hypothetical protein
MLLLWQYKTYTLAVKNNNLLLYLLSQGYMFRLLRVIIRPVTEPIQDYLTTSALWDPVGVETCSPVIVDIIINCCVWLPKYMSYIVIRNTSGCLALSYCYDGHPSPCDFVFTLSCTISVFTNPIKNTEFLSYRNLGLFCHLLHLCNRYHKGTYIIYFLLVAAYVYGLSTYDQNVQDPYTLLFSQLLYGIRQGSHIPGLSANCIRPSDWYFSYSLGDGWVPKIFFA